MLLFSYGYAACLICFSPFMELKGKTECDKTKIMDWLLRPVNKNNIARNCFK